MKKEKKLKLKKEWDWLYKNGKLDEEAVLKFLESCVPNLNR